MNNKIKKIKRKKFIINKKVQFSYAVFLIWILCLTLLLTGTAIYSIIMNTVIDKFSETGNIDIYQTIAAINRMLVLRIGLLSVVLIAGGGILEILYIHRVAGPLSRIEKIIKDLINKDVEYQPIKFRKGDFFHGLADNLHKFIEKQQREKTIVSEKMDKIVQQYPQLKEKIDEIKKSL